MDSRGHKNHSPFSFSTFLTSEPFLLLIVLLFLIISISLWQNQKDRDLARLEDATENSAVTITRALELQYQNIRQTLERLSLTSQELLNEPTVRWEEEAGYYVESVKALRSLYLFDTALERIAGYPEEALIHTFDELEHGPAESSIVFPVYEGQELAGVLVAEVDLQLLLQQVTSEGPQDFAARLRTQDEESLAGVDSPDKRLASIQQVVLDEKTTLILQVLPMESFKRQGLVPARNSLIYMLLITAIIAIAVRLAQGYYRHSALNSRQYRELLENVALVALTVKRDGTIDFCNGYLSELTGYSRQELLGADLFRLLLPQTTKKEIALFFEALQKGFIPSQQRVRIVTKAQRDCFLSLNNTILKDTKGRVLGFASIGEDITRRLESERQLFLQSSALSSAGDGIAILDGDMRIRWANSALYELIGYSPKEVFGRTFGQLIRSDKQDEAFFERMNEQVSSGKVWRGEVVNRRKDGSEYTEYMTLTPVRETDGSIEHYIAIKRDVSEQKRLEQENRDLARQYAASQRLESLGKLSAGIAHDFNNLLVPIVGYAELGMLECEEASKAYEQFVLIRDSGFKAAELTKQILAFGRKQTLDLRTQDMNVLVRGLESMLRLLTKERIKLVFELWEKEVPFDVDRGQFEQVIMNLAVNAKDAMNGVGTLVVKTGIEQEQAVLSFSDDGCGMSEETLSHIYEPFFTTKAQGQGTGLGLSTVFGIVGQHNGTIEVSSIVTEGTTFTLRFPLSEHLL